MGVIGIVKMAVADFREQYEYEGYTCRKVEVREVKNEP